MENKNHFDPNKLWVKQQLPDFGSDNCRYLQANALHISGVRVLRVINNGTVTDFKTDLMTGCFHNPNKDTFTITMKGPTYYTYSRAKINIQTFSTSNEPHPAISKAEDIINGKD